MTLHLSQRGLTDARTFIGFLQGGGRAGLLESVGDPPAGQVVGLKLYEDAVSRKKFHELDADVPPDMGENLVTFRQFYLEHVVR